MQGKTKCIQIEKEKVKLSLIIDDMILHVENPKESTQKLLRTMTSTKFRDTRSKYKSQFYVYTKWKNTPCSRTGSEYC